MQTTVIYGDRLSSVPSAVAEGDNLWLSLDELQKASGWELKPQGACLADTCVPIPAAREAEFLRAGGKQFNLTTLARRLGQPVVHDDTHNVWFFGEAAEVRGTALASLNEFAPSHLAFLDGKPHSLSDYRGKKTLLVSWASW